MITDERMIHADKAARITGRSLWRMLTRDQVIELVDFDEDEPDGTLWEALLRYLRTQVLAAHSTPDGSFLIQDVSDQDNPKG